MIDDARRSRIAAMLLLVVLCAATWREVRGFAFVLWDDDEYVYANPIVTGGVTTAAVARAFGFHAGNWHPLTWLSHMLDVEWFGLDPGAHHVTSAALHTLNALLLFTVLTRFTAREGRQAIRRSFFVAALFAVHPLNVENVAWISERKTLLSIAFALLTLLAWHAWTETRRPHTLVAATASFALALMAKPYVVMLPLMLFALDLWPLRRLRRDSLRALILEKTPLFACSLASAAVTLLAQSREGAVAVAGSLPIGERIVHAVTAYGWYLWKAVWPSGLIFFHPHPLTNADSVPRGPAIASLALLAAITIVAVRFRRAAPALLAGWSWYLVALVPVSGIVQAGQQAWAGRYACLPLIGIFVAVVWLIGDAGRRANARAVALAAGIALLLVLSVTTVRQARHWRDSGALFAHALAVDPENWAAWQNVGVMALAREDLAGAITASERSLAANPRNALAMYNIAYAWSLRGMPHVALPWYERALVVRPDDPKILAALALTLRETGHAARGLQLARRAVAADPSSDVALYAAALTAAEAGELAEAAAAVRRLRASTPHLADDAEIALRRRGW